MRTEILNRQGIPVASATVYTYRQTKKKKEMAKTYNNLYQEIYDFDRLLSSYIKARKGKRGRNEVMLFHYNYEGELIDIQNQLMWDMWITGEYRHFVLLQPVYRVGAALPFRDRVLHHSLVSVINPCFEPRFITHTYACIKNRGTHSGADKAQQMLRIVKRNSGGELYVFKGDIAGYFYNINHAILKRLVRKRVTCQRTLKLIDEIIDSSADPNELNPKGIPLGNLTSQLFANIYLAELDNFVKHTLRERFYLRYMDDFCIIHHDKNHLQYLRAEIEQFLHDELQLNTNRKTQVFPVTNGKGGRSLDFLGYRIWPTHRKLRKSSIQRITRSLTRLQRKYATGEISLDDVRSVVHSWLAHASHADTYGLRVKILGTFPMIKDLSGERYTNDTRTTEWPAAIELAEFSNWMDCPW